MHSHDRTLLANLGFADSDRKEPLHELACQYLTQAEVANVIGNRFQWKVLDFSRTIGREVEHKCQKPNYGFKGKYELTRISKYRFSNVQLEKPLTEVQVVKGSGQYQTTIGFMDVVLAFEKKFRLVQSEDIQGKCSQCKGACNKSLEAEDLVPDEIVTNGDFLVSIEVKISKVQVSECIRQIDLYRSYYSKKTLWMLATIWELNNLEYECLKNQRIFHIFLGDGFHRFCEKARDAPSTRNSLAL